MLNNGIHVVSLYIDNNFIESKKNPMLKKMLVSLSILLFVVSLKSQIIEDWTSARALTDSSSFNSNPVVCNLQDFGSGELFMFYEKKQNQPGQSQIWWKKLSGSMSEEQMLIGGWPDVDYRNPQVWYNSFLIFECNAFGNYDIFGVRFDETGTVGATFQLTNTVYDENSFFCTTYFSDLCCWESQGNIVTSELQISQDTLKFTNLEIIDSVNCFDPVCEIGYIAWRKVENSESHLYYSRKTYPQWQWSEPDTIIQTNDNTNLSTSTTIQEMGEGYNLCWQASDKIYFIDKFAHNPIISSPEIPGIEKYYEPTAFNVIVLVDNMPELYSFAGQTASSRDIYIVDDFMSGYILNITEDSLINKTPKLFSGRVDWPYYEIVNIWQTEIDGYEVLFESNAWYWATGGFDEDVLSELYISPNPVGYNQNITIHSSENIFVNSVQVCTVGGNLILEKKINSQSHHYEIDLNNVLSGVYFIKIQTSKGVTVCKIIKV